MTEAATRLCEWDSEANPTFNLWTIGNASEVVPGISTPCISTMGTEFVAESGRLVVQQLGINDLVAVYEPPVGNWAAVIGGRWALNLAWFNAAISSWQTGGASGLMEQFISSTDGHDITTAASADTARAERTWQRVRRIRAALPRAVAADRRTIDALRDAERQRDFAKMSVRQIWRHSLHLRTRCARLLARHLHVSLAAGDYTDRLNKLLERALPAEVYTPALVIMLTSALRDVESAAPAKGSWGVARRIARRKKLAAAVRELPAHEIAARLQQPKGADWKAFAGWFQEFIDRFGFRGMGEVDPAFADWEEAPAYAISTIKVFLDAGEEHNPYTLEANAARQREAVEAQIAPLVPAAEQAVYRSLLTSAQTFARLRESSKANWVRGDRLLRRPMLAVAQRWVEQGLIDEAGDIFWLVADESARAIDGKLHGAAAREAIATRKREARRLEELDLPEVFELPVKAKPKASPEMDGNVLTGVGVSAGKATGRARVVLSTESALEVELEPGEVLVAPFTDAPWTPLFVPAAAVVVETGGVLSHAATVAREYGIPAVVAVKGATRLIQTGQLVTVDGMTGTVTVA